MSQTPEGKVKGAIRDYLREIGAWFFMPSMNGFGRAGIPDFIVCHQGRFIALEAKAPGGKPTQWQLRELGYITTAGGTAMVAWSVEDVKEALSCA